MTAPNPVGGIGNVAPGMAPATAATNGELDATECDKVLLMVSGVALAGAETVKIYARNTGTTAVGAGPAGIGTTTVYDQTGAAAQLSATLQSVMLEGGFWYVFQKSATVGLVGVDIQFKRGESA